MRHTVTLIPGDGIGPEVTKPTLAIIKAAGVNIEWETHLAGVKARYQNVDLIVVRENTEGLYSGIEHEVVPGVVESLKIMTEKASTRIAKFAFDYARSFGRKQVVAVHKANIMKLGDGLFLDCARKIAGKYEGIGFSDIIIDNACLQLVLDPTTFDVLLLENL